MKGFLFEMHAHTAEVSACGVKGAAEVFKMYHDAGYDGIIVTDHLKSGTFKSIKNLGWEKKVEHYLEGYRIMKSLVNDDFCVLLGMEVTFAENDNDYLVYGFDEDFLFNNINLLEMNLAKFKRLAEKNNLLVFQAHPFRDNMTIVDPFLLDGIEVYNGNSSHNSRNDIANLWADKFGLRKVSSSDFHNFWGMMPGGVYFKNKIKNNKDLVEALKNNEYTLK